MTPQEQALEALKEAMRDAILAAARYGPATTLAEVTMWAALNDYLSSAAPAAGEGASPAARDVLAERLRQISVEGWTPEHDDEHSTGEMARAAACYANPDLPSVLEGTVGIGWPWDHSWWKPAGPRRNLVKAGALIIAEIERLDRAACVVTPPAPSATSAESESFKRWWSRYVRREWTAEEQSIAMHAALDAVKQFSAAPTVMDEKVEREAFEAWIVALHPSAGPELLGKEENDETTYVYGSIGKQWRAWKARATLHATQADAPVAKPVAPGWTSREIIEACDAAGIDDRAFRRLMSVLKVADKQAHDYHVTDHEVEMDQALSERDEREEVINAILDEVLGLDRHEWSSAYGFSDAIEDVKTRMWSLARPPAPEEGKDAARYRLWREGMLATDMHFVEAVAAALPSEVPDARQPTAAEWDAALDAVIAAKRGAA